MNSRRSFLRNSGAAAALVLSSRAAGATPGTAAQNGQKPNKIIHVVSDGMSVGTLTCADQFSLLTRKRPLAWTTLLRDPGASTAVVNMRSLNSLVTDSAAASSAWGSGSRVVNGTLNVLPDGRDLTPILPLLSARGWKTGLVSTAEITHATPAGFAVAVESRADARQIASLYLKCGVDVLLGGGSDFFDAARRPDGKDLFAAFRAAGYALATNRKELAAAAGARRILGTFCPGHLPYTLDHLASTAAMKTIPTLAGMTRAALDCLAGSDRFFLQVEGARIDHAAHNSDAAAAIHDQLALDDALEACLAFQKEHPDTLVVVTTDHGNSNPGLNGMGGGYDSSSPLFANLARVKCSFPEILGLMEKAGEIEEKETESAQSDQEKKLTAAVKARHLRIEPKAIQEILAETTGYKVPESKAERFARVLAGKSSFLYDQMSQPVTQLGQLLANHLGIGWTGNTHTADYCPLIAIGPGSGGFRGFLENTDLFRLYTGLAGVDFRNPDVPLLAEQGPSASHAEGFRMV